MESCCTNVRPMAGASYGRFVKSKAEESATEITAYLLVLRSVCDHRPKNLVKGWHAVTALQDKLRLTTLMSLNGTFA